MIHVHVVSKRDSFPIAQKERLFFFLKNILKL